MSAASLAAAPLLAGEAAEAPKALCPAPARWTGDAKGVLAANRGLTNVIRVGADGSYRWNGTPVDAAKIQTLFSIVKAIPSTYLVLDRKEADCNKLAAVIKLAEKAGICHDQHCLIGEEIETPPIIAPPPPPAPRR